jgi:hypothetical protein
MKNLKIDYYDYETEKQMEEKEFIVESIRKVTESLDQAYNNFNLITDPELIDSCIYELKSMQLKYRYLIQQAKELGIIVNKI